jgi:hypothetical protein
MNKLVRFARIGAIPSLLLCIIVWTDLVIPSTRMEAGPTLHKIGNKLINHSRTYQVCNVTDSFYEEVAIGDTISVEVSNMLKWCRRITLIRNGVPVISIIDIQTLKDSFISLFLLIPAYVFRRPERWYTNRTFLSAYFIIISLNVILWISYFVL